MKNREILFRGMRADNGKWVYGFYVKQSFGFGFDDAIMVYNDWSTVPYKILPETLGQYTGLDDEDGNKIFEGDIIYQYGEYLGVVEWDKKECVYFAVSCLGCMFTQMPCNESFPQGVKAVGNKYNNPELMDEDEEGEDL